MSTCNPNLPAFRPPPALPAIFGDEPLPTFMVDGRAFILARDLGELLGYHGDGKRLVTSIRREWAEEFEEGEDYEMLSKAQIMASNAYNLKSAPDAPLSNRGQICLTTSGVLMVAANTDKKPGRVMRRYVVRELIPWAAEQAQLYAAGANPPRPAAAPDLAQRRLTLRELREARLRRAQEIRAMKAARTLDVVSEVEERAMLRRHLRELALEQGPIEASPEVATEPQGRTTTDVVLRSARRLLPQRKALPDADRPLPAPAREIADEWLSPMELAHALGMVGTYEEQAARIGRAITGAGLREHPTLTHPLRVPKRVKGEFLGNEDGSVKTTRGWVYRPSVIPKLEAWMHANKREWLGLAGEG